MMYTGHDGQEQAQLECDLLNKRHVKLKTGRTWKPEIVKHAGWRDVVPKNYWHPVEVLPTSDHDALAMHARRTCHHAS